MGSMVVPIRADQLLPQFLLEPFDTLGQIFLFIDLRTEPTLIFRKVEKKNKSDALEIYFYFFLLP